mmetsp:Transcript_22278/g.68561  ORF Transcript_22278/g.68561 Transcript_22278/m.68561 type:complete len:264 (-) Transcript_22278:20-811(-)
MALVPRRPEQRPYFAAQQRKQGGRPAQRERRRSAGDGIERKRPTFRDARTREHELVAQRLEAGDEALSAIVWATDVAASRGESLAANDEVPLQDDVGAQAQLAAACGQLAAVVEFCEAKLALAQDETLSSRRELKRLRARVACDVELDNSRANDEAVQQETAVDDDDDDWVPPSARVRVEAWTDARCTSEVGQGGETESERVERMRQLLADEQAAHRATKRSLETQILRRDAQLRKLQAWADEKSRLFDTPRSQSLLCLRATL